MTDIADFVLARIGDREAKARAAMPLFSAILGPEELNAHLRLNDPAAVLARCAADRQIVVLHETMQVASTIIARPCCKTCSAYGEYPGEFPCSTMRLLASLDAGHPDYDESWAASCSA